MIAQLNTDETTGQDRMPKPIQRLLSASGVAILLLFFNVNTMSGQERAPAVRPSWRLMLDNSRAWGLGGGTPNGRGNTASVAGRRRIATDSPVAFELGLMLGAYERPRSTREPANPFGETASDTTRRLALIGTYAAMSVDLLAGRRSSVFAETGVYFGAVRDRTRYDKTTTIERQVGQRFGLTGGVGVRLPNGLGLKARYLWVSVPSRPINVAELVTSLTLF